jgi:hypothetical protein
MIGMEKSEAMSQVQFLRRFFGEGNRFEYADILEKEESAYASIRQWVTDLKQQNQPVVLPRWTENGVTWYGVATSEQAAQQLAEEVKAFVGPSYSTFTGERVKLDEDDPVEQSIRDFAGGTTLKFTGDDREIRRALDRMHDVRGRRTPHQQDEDLGVGIVLRRFEMALRAGDRTSAEEHLGYLRERSLIDRRNLRHLVVRMLAAFRAWEELLEREEISDLLQQEGRPLRVTRALIQAVYHTHIAAFEDDGDPEGAVEHFRSSVLPEYGDLFAARASMQAPEVLKAFMLKAVSGEEFDEGLYADLIEGAEDTGLDDPFFDALTERGAGAGEPPVVENPISEAMTAWTEGDPDTAFRMLRQAEPSARKGQCLALVHGELRSLDVEQELKATLNSLSPEDQQGLAQQHSICRQIVESVGTASNWRHWLSRVREGHYDTQEEALQQAEKLVEEWHPQQVLEEQGTLEKLVEEVQIAPLDGWEGRIVSLALPRLLESLQSDPEYPRSTFQSLYGAVLTRIPYAEDLTKSDLLVYRDLAEVQLSYGVDETTYQDVLYGAGTLWKEAGAPGRIDWLLDFAELLVLAPSQDKEGQLRFLTTVLQAIQQHRGRVERIQVELFRSLCTEVGHPEIAKQLRTEQSDEGQQESDPLCDLLRGQTLGIYTLTKSAGRRTTEFLEDRCSDLTVHLRHDKAGNADLERAAKNADYFLVVTRSATHAATDVIEQHVPVERLIRPRGKGQSSMLRDLTEYARSRV